jgi:pyruvate formate lyase activating enzyme
LRYLKRETSVWFEITTLLIPGQNDSEAEVDQLSAWIASELGPDVPLHFTAFHPDFKLTDLPRTPASTCLRARAQAKAHGLRHVYAGNISEQDGQITACPECHTALIKRDWYDLDTYALRGSHCPQCSARIAGVFDERGHGTWGRRRLRLAIG